jgi:hypothetical protein
VRAAAAPSAAGGTDLDAACAALVHSLGGLPQLSSLALRVKPRRWALSSLAPWQAALAPLTALSALDLSEFAAITPAVVHALGRALLQLTNLTRLRLEALQAGEDAAVGAEVAALPLPVALRSLVLGHIGWGPRSNVRTLGQRVRSLPQLSHVHFASVDGEAVASHRIWPP